ncbi:hypothetical protein [Paenibacillus lactis]
MTVRQLIDVLSGMDGDKKVVISTEGGFVEDDDVTLIEREDVIVLEI